MTPVLTLSSTRAPQRRQRAFWAPFLIAIAIGTVLLVTVLFLTIGAPPADASAARELACVAGQPIVSDDPDSPDTDGDEAAEAGSPNTDGAADGSDGDVQPESPDTDGPADVEPIPFDAEDEQARIDALNPSACVVSAAAQLDFSCTSYENRISWPDVGQSRYWVYRSVDNGATWNWVGRTLGETTFVDPAPDLGVRYEVNFAGRAREACVVTAPVVFKCASYEGRIAWSDAGRTKYWVYRSVDGGSTWSWLGRTFGDTTMVDANPTVGAKYQVHYAGIARQSCGTEPALSAQAEPFSCSVNGNLISWQDYDQARYWLYRSNDDGATWSWLGRTLGATSFVDPNAAPGAKYQVHHPGIARQTCRDGSTSGIGRLLLEGESTVVRPEFTAEIARYAASSDLVNDGNSGDQITRLNNEAAIQAANISGQDDVAVLWIGINDLSANRQASAVYADMAQWVTERRAAGWDKFVLLTVTRFENPASSRGGRPIEVIDQRRRELNDLIVANSVGADAIVDLRSIAGIGDSFSVFDPYWRTDGVHFTGRDQGGGAYEVIGELVGRSIAGLPR